MAESQRMKVRDLSVNLAIGVWARSQLYMYPWQCPAENVQLGLHRSQRATYLCEAEPFSRTLDCLQTFVLAPSQEAKNSSEAGIYTGRREQEISISHRVCFFTTLQNRKRPRLAALASIVPVCSGSSANPLERTIVTGAHFLLCCHVCFLGLAPLFFLHV